jgi:hypothetical protein
MTGPYIKRDPYSFKSRNPLLRTTSFMVKLAVSLASVGRLAHGQRSIIFTTPNGYWMDGAAQAGELLERWGLIETDPKRRHWYRLTARGEGCLTASGIDVAATIAKYDRGHRALLRAEEA